MSIFPLVLRNAAILASVSIVMMAVPCASAESDGTARSTEFLTGNWGGLRTDWARRGFSPFALYTAGFWANVRGGADQGARYEGFAHWGLDTDLEAALGWPGGRIHIDGHSYHGGQPTDHLVGAFGLHAVSGVEAQESVRLYEVYLEQIAFQDRFRLKIGQIALDQDFMLSESAGLFRNGVFGDFVSSAGTVPAAVYPLAAPGVLVEAEPVTDWRVRVGAYSADPGRDERDNYGLGATFSRRAGATIVTELETERRPFGRRGVYLVGMFNQTGKLENYDRGGLSDGLDVIYASIDQVLTEADPTSSAWKWELGVFLRGNFPVQKDRTAIDWAVNGGAVLRGALPGRSKDSFGIGFSYIEFEHDFVQAQRAIGSRVKRAEVVLELSYEARITDWLSVQPDVQVFVDPYIGRRNALVLGLSATLRL